MTSSADSDNNSPENSPPDAERPVIIVSGSEEQTRFDSDADQPPNFESSFNFGQVPPHFQMRQVQFSGCLVLFLLLFAGCLLPYFLIETAQTALANLNLSSTGAILVIVGILFGSAINLPISRRLTGRTIEVSHQNSGPSWPPVSRSANLREELIIAVNVGGCLIPVLLAVWVLRSLLEQGGQVGIVLAVGVVLNILACFYYSKPVPGLGIRLPLWVPAAVALIVTWTGLNDPAYAAHTSSTAFVIGVSGPLIGADLLRWKDYHKIGAGMVSIGGAGTWDGILLAGLASAFFA